MKALINKYGARADVWDGIAQELEDNPNEAKEYAEKVQKLIGEEEKKKLEEEEEKEKDVAAPKDDGEGKKKVRVLKQAAKSIGGGSRNIKKRDEEA